MDLSAFPLGLSAFPVGLSAFPVHLSAFPVGLSAFPVGLSAFPLGLLTFPVGLSAFPLGPNEAILTLSPDVQLKKPTRNLQKTFNHSLSHPRLQAREVRTAYHCAFACFKLGLSGTGPQSYIRCLWTGRTGRHSDRSLTARPVSLYRH